MKNINICTAEWLWMLIQRCKAQDICLGAFWHGANCFPQSTYTHNASQLRLHTVSDLVLPKSVAVGKTPRQAFACSIGRILRGQVAIITKPGPPFPIRDVVMVPGLLPIFLYGCEIKSGSGLGTRLPFLDFVSGRSWSWQTAHARVGGVVWWTSTFHFLAVFWYHLSVYRIVDFVPAGKKFLYTVN